MSSDAKPDNPGIEHLATPIKVSRIALGAWAMGGWKWGGTDVAPAIGVIHEAVDRGVTLIDTAPAYGFGRLEEIVGKTLAIGSTGSRRKIPKGMSSISPCAGSWTGKTRRSRVWGARKPDQPDPIAGLARGRIDTSAMAEFDRIVSETIVSAVGPEFMASPVQLAAQIHRNAHPRRMTCSST
jgi:hypothetical protein